MRACKAHSLLTQVTIEIDSLFEGLSNRARRFEHASKELCMDYFVNPWASWTALQQQGAEQAHQPDERGYGAAVQGAIIISEGSSQGQDPLL